MVCKSGFPSRFIMIFFIGSWMAGCLAPESRSLEDCPEFSGFNASVYPLPPERPLEVVFTRPVISGENPRAAGVYLVPQRKAGVCNPACPGECHLGNCFVSQVDEGFLKNASSGLLTAGRWEKSIELSIQTEEERWWIRPKTGSLDPAWRYDLVLGPRIRDEKGYPLVNGQGKSVAFVLSFSTSRPDDLMANVELLAPLDAAKTVPQNLAILAVRIHGKEANRPDLFVLETKDKEVIALDATLFPQACLGMEHDHECLILWINGPLRAKTSYRLRVVRRHRLLGGRFLLPWQVVAEFSTGEISWLYPPRMEERDPGELTGCLHLHGALEGEAMVWLSGPSGPVGMAQYQRWGEFELAGRESRMRLEGLSLEGTLFFGNQMEFEPATGEIPVIIETVHPNPFGPEPAQEFIELRNISSQAVDLEGFEITDHLEKSGDLLPPFILLPGDLVRVAGKNYDPTSPVDPPPVSDVIVLDSSLANAGLANKGEPVYLFDTRGELISRYGGWFDTTRHEGLMIRRKTPCACDVKSSWHFVAP